MCKSSIQRTARGHQLKPKPRRVEPPGGYVRGADRPRFPRGGDIQLGATNIRLSARFSFDPDADLEPAAAARKKTSISRLDWTFGTNDSLITDDGAAAPSTSGSPAPDGRSRRRSRSCSSRRIRSVPTASPPGPPTASCSWRAVAGSWIRRRERVAPADGGSGSKPGFGGSAGVATIPWLRRPSWAESSLNRNCMVVSTASDG